MSSDDDVLNDEIFLKTTILLQRDFVVFLNFKKSSIKQFQKLNIL